MRVGAVYLIAASVFSVVALSGGAGLCDQDDRAEAKRIYGEGRDLQDQGKYLEATIRFEEALALYPAKGIVFNLASCYAAVGDDPKAYRMFRRLLTEFEDKIDEGMRRSATDHLRVLRKRVALVVVEASEEGAAVVVDGEHVGETPLAGPLVLEPGKHLVGVSLAGLEPVVKEVWAGAGKTSKERFHLEPRKDTPSAASTAHGASLPSAEVEEDDEGGMSGLFWGGVALTGASAVAAIVLDILAGLKRDEIEDYNEGWTSGEPDISDDDYDAYTDGYEEREDLMNKYQYSALGLAIGGGLALLGTIIVGVHDAKADDDDEGPEVSASPGGITVSF